MARPTSSQPTDVELQILGVLWNLGPATVREIHDAFTAIKGKNYSTTVKMLSVMLEKGLVARDESVRPLVYRASKGRGATQQSMLRDLMRRAYDGSAGSLVLQALSSKRATPDELAKIRELLDELEKRSS